MPVNKDKNIKYPETMSKSVYELRCFNVYFSNWETSHTAFDITKATLFVSFCFKFLPIIS